MSRFSGSKRVCVFCGVNKVTNEHVYPVWIGELLNDHLKVEEWIGSRPTGATWGEAKLNVKVKRICKTCNETWMSQLEDETIPVLTPLILGESVPLNVSIGDQVTLSKWVYKTALMASFVEAGSIRRAAYAEYFDHRFPPIHSVISIAAHNGTPFVSLRLREGRLLLKWKREDESGEINTDLHVITFSIFRVIFQTVLYDGDLLPPGAFANIEATQIIWPTPTPLVWPPEMKALSDEALKQFANRPDWKGSTFKFRT